MNKFYIILNFIFIFSISFISAEISSSPFHVVTVASHPTTTLRQLMESCELNEIQIEVLGMGLPYKGNGQKLSYLKKHLKNIPDDHIVMFIDAYDCLILANQEQILNKFLRANTQCVISAETNLYPHTQLMNRYPISPTKFKYLNSGSIIGYAGYLKKLLKSLKPINKRGSDQGQLMIYYIDHQDEIVLDFFCELFIPLHQIDLSELELNPETHTVHCLITDTKPCVVHGNGGGKLLYQHIYNTLFPKKSIVKPIKFSQRNPLITKKRNEKLN